MEVASAQPREAELPFNRTLFFLSLALFFIWGFATVLVDILVPKLKGLFSLGYTEVMLTQFAFFLGYLAFSLPAGWIVGRIGYMRGIMLGLIVMATGCLLFIPAAWSGLFPAFLLALFVMAAGITMLQVAANAVIAMVGPASSSSARLTLAQAFNALGTTVGPLIGAKLVLESGIDLPADFASLSAAAQATVRSEEAQAILPLFIGIASILAVLIVIFWLARDLLPRRTGEAAPASIGLDLLRNRRLLFGVVAIFAYVGAEVSIGSMLVNYLMQPATLGIGAAEAGRLVSFYWGGAMVGRFAGALVLSRFRPGRVLSINALAAIALALTSASTSGSVATVTILMVGLMNSIMFPTIFSLALDGTGEDAPRASALLCMGVVGGAILPLVAGNVADHAGLSMALLVPVIGYAWVAFFGAFTLRHRAEQRG